MFCILVSKSDIRSICTQVLQLSAKLCQHQLRAETYFSCCRGAALKTYAVFGAVVPLSILCTEIQDVYAVYGVASDQNSAWAHVLEASRPTQDVHWCLLRNVTTRVHHEVLSFLTCYHCKNPNTGVPSYFHVLPNFVKTCQWPCWST